MGNAFGGVSGRRSSRRACRKAFWSELRSSRCAYPQGRAACGPKLDSNASITASPTLPVCLPQVNLACLKLSLPDGGRRVLLGAAAPRSTPFHPPPATPLGRVHSSHPAPFGFWEKPPCRVPAPRAVPFFFGKSWADYTRLEGQDVSGRRASSQRSAGQSRSREGPGSVPEGRQF